MPIDVVCGAGTPHWWSPRCAVCSLHSAASSLTYFWNRYSKPNKWRKNQVHENCGVRVGTCGSLSQTQPKTPSRVPNCYFPNPLKKFMMKSTSVQIHFIENAVYKLMKELECFKCWLESSFNVKKWLFVYWSWYYLSWYHHLGKIIA